MNSATLFLTLRSATRTARDAVLSTKAVKAYRVDLRTQRDPEGGTSMGYVVTLLNANREPVAVI